MILKMKMMSIDDGDGIVIYNRAALHVHVCESMAPFINIYFGWVLGQFPQKVQICEILIYISCLN